MQKDLQRLKDKKKEAEGVVKNVTEIFTEKTQKFQVIRGAREEFEGKSKSLQSLLKAQKDGLLSGIHDRLGNLGTIDKKYDIAISTACSQLDFVLVDSQDHGQQAV